MSPAQRAAALSRLTNDEALALAHDWSAWARAEQLAPPGDWFVWLILAGRGWGKTRTGAEFVRDRVERGVARRIALVARTAADTRDVMLEGESGLLNVFPPRQRPHYESSKRRVTFHTGAVATLYSADEPNLLRGPQHDTAWADELASWSYPEAWDHLVFGLRLGLPRAVVTTTPRPTELVRALAQRPTTVLTRGSTYDNARNLARSFLDEVRAKYEGTRLGRQELYAEILDDAPGALWSRAQIERAFCRARPSLARVVVAVDPSVAADGGGDECGIVAAGLDHEGAPWVLRDASGNLSPEAWASKACALAAELEADCLVAEANNGGALVESVLRSAWNEPKKLPPRIKLVHAKRGKALRAEPIAALYEQGRVLHAPGLTALEDEMCTWASASGDPSPNRVDALVYALTELCLSAPAASLAGVSKYRGALPRARM